VTLLRLSRRQQVQPVENVKARDEITAHMGIFVKQNAEYGELTNRSLHLMSSWVRQGYNERH